MTNERKPRSATGGSAFGNSTWLVVVLCVLLFLWLLSFAPPLGLLSVPGPIRVSGFAGILSFLLAVWVGFDASKRGWSGVLWGVLVFFTSIVGLIVYLLVAQTGGFTKQSADEQETRANSPHFMPTSVSKAPPSAPPALCCAQCARGLQVDFHVCPYCGAPRADLCPGCREHVEANWKVCPHCTRPLGGAPG